MEWRGAGVGHCSMIATQIRDLRRACFVNLGGVVVFMGMETLYFELAVGFLIPFPGEYETKCPFLYKEIAK